MKSVLILAVISLSFSALANPTKFVVQKDLIVNQKISQTNPDSGHYLMVRFMDDGSTTDEVIEPSCLLYIYSPGAEVTIPAGTVLSIKSSNVDNPQDTSQAILHKDRSVSIHANTGSEQNEFRVNCSDSAMTYKGLKDFDIETINQFTSQFVILE